MFDWLALAGDWEIARIEKLAACWICFSFGWPRFFKCRAFKPSSNPSVTRKFQRSLKRNWNKSPLRMRETFAMVMTYVMKNAKVIFIYNSKSSLRGLTYAYAYVPFRSDAKLTKHWFAGLSKCKSHKISKNGLGFYSPSRGLVSHHTDLATNIFQTIHITRKTISYCTYACSYFYTLEILDR